MDFSPSPFIAATKRHLRGPSDQSLAFAEVRGAIRAEVDALQGEIARGGSGVPELRYSDVESNSVSSELLASIRRKGCAIIRGVFAQAQADAWNREIGDYIEANDYFTKARAKAGLDEYFSQLKDAVPQIFGIYWSKPQVMARQAPQMATTKRFLNRLWDVRGPAGDEFDPDQDFSYADRTRRRQPGDTTLGLSPHMDAGSYERWVDPAFQAIYAPVFNGRWRDYDPWKATYRTQTREFSSPAVASMFRTFQGWTGLTEQGPNGGTLQLMPSTLAIAYVLLRALQDDVAEDDLCGAAPGRALGANLAQHPDLLAGLITIPVVYPGDTVLAASRHYPCGGKRQYIAKLGERDLYRGLAALRQECRLRRQTGAGLLAGPLRPRFRPRGLRGGFHRPRHAGRPDPARPGADGALADRAGQQVRPRANGVALRHSCDYSAAVDHRRGEVPERSNGAVSKTVEDASPPRVRIPVSPPNMIEIIAYFGDFASFST